MKHPVIALMTDFGEDDFFVASLKGVIIKINPLVRIIDISHQVRSFDIQSGGFILFSCYKYFPRQTIFLVIVDPGVGSSRRILLAETRDYFFIAPDNGVLSLVLKEEEILQVREVTNKRFFLPELSKTFEGRDRMAPAAAYLSKGVSGEEFGAKTTHYKKFTVKKPSLENNEIRGRIIYTDKFGNLITNIPVQMIDQFQEKTGREKISCKAEGTTISLFKKNYSSAKKGELLFLVGSLGLIEIAAKEASAAEKLKAKTGDKIRIIVRERKT